VDIYKFRFFDDLLADDGSKQVYRNMLSFGERFVIKLQNFSHEAVGLCFKEAGKLNRRHDVILLAKARRYLVLFDGVKTLLANGSSEVCFPLLRAMLEAFLGIAHIVQDKHQERAFAYALARIMRKIEEYRRVDINTPQGKALQAELAKDEFTPNILKHIPSHVGGWADKMEKEISTDTDFIPIVAEWNRLANPPGKKPRTPKWYELFGGKGNLRELAKQLNKLSLYEFMYRDWSDSSHVGDALNTFADIDGTLNPVRFPQDYPKVIGYLFMIFLNLVHSLVNFYNPSSAESMRFYAANELEPEFQHVQRELAKVLKSMK
jgi:hypothetical protein